MKQFKIWITVALLVAGIVILIMKLFNPSPIQIILETGQEVTSKSAEYFTLSTALILIICSFVIGAAITFLFYNADTGEKKKTAEVVVHTNYDVIMPLLRDDEKKVVKILREHKGEMLQNELVLKLGISKVKATRLLASLERKQVVEKKRHGLTNHVKMKF
jgi:uncharacterized membrane protein